MTVHTVIFDAGLTLLGVQPSWPEVFVEGAAAAGVEVTFPTEPDPALFGVWRDHDRAWRAAGEPSPHLGDDDAERRFWIGLYRRFLEALAVDADHHVVAASILEAFQAPGVFVAYDEVRDVLDDLDARGVRVGLLSNWSPLLRDILEHQELIARFEVVVISGEVGHVKPDPEIFHRALQDLDVDAGPGVAYVGDDVSADVEPSLALGLTPVLVDRFGQHPDAQVRRVTDLRQLTDVLDLPGRRA